MNGSSLSTEASTALLTEEERKEASRRLRSKAVRGGAVLMAARLLVQILLWGVTLTVASLLTPADYGIMSVGVVFICLADMLAEAGVGRALIQKENLTQADLAAAFTLNLLLALTLYALLFATAGFAADFMDMPGLELMLPILGVMVLLAPFKAISYALLDRDLRMERQAAVFVVFSVLQSAIVLTMAVFGYGYWSLVVGAVLGRAFEVVGLYLATRWTPRLCWTPWRHGDLVRFGMNVSFSSLLLFFYNNSIFVIVGRVVGQTTLGYFSLAFQIISLPTQKLTISTNQVVYPVFCRLRDDRATLRDWYIRLCVFLGFLGIPTLAGMAVVAPEAFGLILGEKWLPAVLPFRLLAIVGMLMIYAATLPPLFDAIGRPDITLRYSAVCAVLFPVASYIGARQGELVGVCIAWMILYPIVILGLVALTRSVTGIGVLDLARPQWPVVLASACMLLVVYLVRCALPALTLIDADPGEVRYRLLWRLILSVLSGAATYAGVILLVGRQTVLADLRALLREVRNRQTPASLPASAESPETAPQTPLLAVEGPAGMAVDDSALCLTHSDPRSDGDLRGG